MPMEVIPEKKVFVKNEARFQKEGKSLIPMFKIWQCKGTTNTFNDLYIYTFGVSLATIMF